jgi:hypothetical protein
MRASKQTQKGNLGTSEVSAAFERIGWGVASNDRHDLGTDLFLAARDARDFDTLDVVGSQVKAGQVTSKSPRRTTWAILSAGGIGTLIVRTSMTGLSTGCHI